MTRDELLIQVKDYLVLEEGARTGVAFQEWHREVFIDQMVYGEVIRRYQDFLARSPDEATNFLDTLPSYTRHGGRPLGLAKDFLNHYFTEVHKILCDDKKSETVEKGAGVGRTSI